MREGRELGTSLLAAKPGLRTVAGCLQTSTLSGSQHWQSGLPSQQLQEGLRFEKSRQTDRMWGFLDSSPRSRF